LLFIEKRSLLLTEKESSLLIERESSSFIEKRSSSFNFHSYIQQTISSKHHINTNHQTILQHQNSLNQAFHIRKDCEERMSK